MEQECIKYSKSLRDVERYIRNELRTVDKPLYPREIWAIIITYIEDRDIWDTRAAQQSALIRSQEISKNYGYRHTDRREE